MLDSKEAKKIVSSVMPRYSGRLTEQQVAEGERLATENAKRLLESARLLLHAGDPATALSLAILALEEHGKIEIIQQIGKAASEKETSEWWQRYRDHKAKTFEFLEQYAKGKAVVDEVAISAFCEENEDMLPLLDLLKQLGFYTDCSGQCRWHNPKSIGYMMAVAIFSSAEEAILGHITPDVKLLGEVAREVAERRQTIIGRHISACL